ncbi:Hypothetical predicted protein [Paramuricea clavata]|uniref:Uncharacterized protein n=1 Tax=Paramuricea clavata TaxID=317549 RepID=A0A7D9D7X1_PARCT|nr:Hypothetical predicted protein [Paramuricea clavata]
MIKELRLCFCAHDNIGQIRKQVTPSSKELEKNLCSFVKRWQTETIDDICVLPKSAVNEALKTLTQILEKSTAHEKLSHDDSESECDTDHAADAEMMSNDDANNIISRAKVMMNLAKEVFNKTQAPIMSHQSNCVRCSVLCEYEKASERLNNVVSNYGFEELPVDGDCCFTSVGYGIEKFFDLDPCLLTDHLKAIDIYKNQDVCERIVCLRELVVMEWLGEYSHEYEMFLIIADKSSFYEMAQQFIQRGVFDCELGNSMLMALSNVLKCPVVIFTSIDTYPIIPLNPRQAPLSAIPIYVAFNQSGKGHYDAIVLQIQCDARVENRVETSCRCGSENTRLQREMQMQEL